MVPGKRTKIIEYIYKAFYWVSLKILGLYMTHQEVAVDYTYYLGPGYKSQMSDTPYSFSASNHVSVIDCTIAALYCYGSVVTLESQRNIPIQHSH